MEPKEELKKLGIEVDSYIEKVNLDNKEMYERYFKAVDPGKKLRGALALVGYKLFKKDYQKAMPAAAGVEIMHKFTLVHDDIGDADEYRRGVETLFKLYDLDDAIYSGDLVGAVAYEQLEKLEKEFDAEKILKCYKLLTHFFKRVHEGQLLDTFFEKRYDIKEEDYFELVRGKTCTALEVALKMGAVLGEGEEYSQALEDYGKYFGYAFQIQNDLNNLLGLEKGFGRRHGSDVYEKKKTLILIKALEMGSEEQVDFIKKMFEKKEMSQEDVDKIIEIMEESGAMDLCKDLVKDYGEKAKKSMETLPDSEAKEILLGFVEHSHITDKGYWTEHAKKGD